MISFYRFYIFFGNQYDGLYKAGVKLLLNELIKEGINFKN